MSELVFPPVRDAFRAIAATVVPEAARMDGATWADVEGLIEEALATRPPAVRRQLRLLVRVIDVLPVVRYGRRITALDPERRTRVLAWVQNAPFLLLRRGLWGLRTLIMLGYYARPTAAAEIGYRAHPNGWEAHR